jgi:hypothetical protein
MINRAQKHNSGDRIMFGDPKFNKKRIQGFGGKPRRKKNLLEDVGVEVRIILE